MTCRFVFPHARLCLCLLAVAAAASAQTRYPERTVRVIAGNVGGLPDTVARLVAQKLGAAWGQAVVVENRLSGTGGMLAAEMVAKAVPDGYTLLVSDTQTLLIHPLIYANPGYSVKDLLPVSLAARAPLFLAVHRSLPVNTLAELIALARAEPGRLNYGSSGIGSTHHLAMEYIKLAFGLNIVHVPYKGTAQSVPALLGGQVQVVFSAYPSLIAHARAGTVKLLASSALRRSSFAPDVPTVAEAADLGDYEFAPPVGFIAPAGMAREIAIRIASGVSLAVRQADVGSKMIGIGIEPVGNTPDEFAAQIKTDGERYARAIRAANVKPE